jgi:hypothetical protein
MNPQAIEVALDHDHGLATGGRRAVQVEKLPGLPEAGRQFVLRQAVIRRTTGVSDGLALSADTAASAAR